MRVLLLESLHSEAEALLSRAAEVIRAREPNDPGVDLRGVRAILTRGRGRIRKELIDSCPELAVIARAGAGLDNLDTAEAARRAITVIYAPGMNASTTAEHTIALMLDLARGVTRWAVQVRLGHWEQRSKYAGIEIRGLTLGVIGFGNIGRRVARLATAFDMRVIVAERNSVAPADCDFPVRPLDALLAESDVVSLHLPLTESTRAIINERTLRLMKHGAILVNTARGELVDQKAAVHALQDGSLGGFGADVLDQEPPSGDEPLLGVDNAILTPHVASLTSETYRRVCLATATNVVAALEGGAVEERCIFRRGR